MTCLVEGIRRSQLKIRDFHYEQKNRKGPEGPAYFSPEQSEYKEHRPGKKVMEEIDRAKTLIEKQWHLRSK